MSYTLYTAVFTFRDMTLRVDTEQGIGEFCDGFWIDADYDLTRGEGAKYWIPPSAIKFIEKTVI